jgi:cytochrome bd-type quinol oxidase subunit 2
MTQQQTRERYMETVLILLLTLLVVYVLVDAWAAIFKAAETVSPGKEVRLMAAGAILYFCGFSTLFTTYFPKPFSSGHGVLYLLAGTMALLVLTMHGALRVTIAASGERQHRARLVASVTYWLVCAAVLAGGIASVAAQPLIAASFTQSPWIWIFPLIATAGLFGLRLCIAIRLDLWAFASSSFFVAGLLCTAVVALFPDLIARAA